MGTVHFETKEEANARMEREFLALSPSQRVQVFIRMVGARQLFEAKVNRKPKNPENFHIYKKKDIANGKASP